MQYDWSNFSSLQFEKYAAHYVKMNFIAANCDIYEDAGGSRGVDFVVKNEKGQYVDIYLATVYIGKTNYVAIPKYYWNKELRENLYVALVLFMDEREPIFYLIPSIVWRTPDELFTDSSNYARNKPSWGINISKNTIPTLAEKYWFENIMLNKKSWLSLGF